MLSDCNNDIDAAIKRLGDMRLREESTSGLQQQPEEASCSAAGTQQERRPSVDGMPQTSGEWVEKLVQEMSASRDVEEARGRGHRFLTAFEAFVNQVSKTCPCLMHDVSYSASLPFSWCSGQDLLARQDTRFAERELYS